MKRDENDKKDLVFAISISLLYLIACIAGIMIKDTAGSILVGSTIILTPILLWVAACRTYERNNGIH